MKNSIKNALIASMLAITSTLAIAETQAKTIEVNPENYIQVETERNINNWSNMQLTQGGDDMWAENYQLGIIGDDAPTVRMNRDTLYRGAGVQAVDKEKGVTFVLPEFDETKIHMSLTVIGNNGFTPLYVTKPGTYTVNTAEAYWILIRVGVKDKTDMDERAAMEALSDAVVMTGAERFEMPDYNMEQLNALTVQYNIDYTASGEPLEYFKDESSYVERFGSIEAGKAKHRWSNSGGFGGMEPVEELSNAYHVTKNTSGDVCTQATFQDPKNKFFTSITVYNEQGYMMEGENHTNSYEWVGNGDGTVTVSFNCGEDAINSLDSNGETFNFAYRHYGISKAVADGTWEAVVATEVEEEGFFKSLFK